ncbi:MAG: DNA-3-methyladenine glycosylase I [Polyangiaceae bacterium]|nr:DNA-3-methyladenine glycosylase I [Polyangiaceae bacterium]
MEEKKPNIYKGTDGKRRCFWCAGNPLYEKYHDEEWGRTTREDHLLFEKICLEGFQSGLSWLTILKKRENFRRAFQNFDLAQVAAMGKNDIEALLANPGIVRHRGKINATINNAAQAIRVVEEFGSLENYFWSFTPPAQERPRAITRSILQGLPHTPTSTALAKDLKARGFQFVGPTTCYAFMQAMGLVNDHMDDCDFKDAQPTLDEDGDGSPRRDFLEK